MGSRLPDLMDLISEIQDPYLSIHPDYEHLDWSRLQTTKRWTLDKCLHELRFCPSAEWRVRVLSRLRLIGYRVPKWVDHPLVDYLLEKEAIRKGGI